MNNTLELLIIVMLLGIMAEIYLTTRPTRKLAHGAAVPTMLVDTSVLMDGRVVDLAKTGFLLGQVVVPRSVSVVRPVAFQASRPSTSRPEISGRVGSG